MVASDLPLTPSRVSLPDEPALFAFSKTALGKELGESSLKMLVFMAADSLMMIVSHNSTVRHQFFLLCTSSILLCTPSILSFMYVINSFFYVRHQFFLFSLCSHSQSSNIPVSYPSIQSHHLATSLNNPMFIHYGTIPEVGENSQDKLLAENSFVDTTLPCDVHLLNFRWVVDDK